MALMQLQLEAQKSLQSDAGIKAEVMRHKSPQIKVLKCSFLFFLFLI